MKKDTIVRDMFKSPVSEAIRTLRTNIAYKMSRSNEKVFLITSSSVDEGKSCVASNLAIAFTQSNYKVLLIDCDLRRGRQCEVFGLDNSNGLVSAIENKKICLNSVFLDEEVGKVVQKTDIENLFVIPSGYTPNNPSELLESKNFDVILSYLKEYFDIIIIDSPPVNIITDTMILCSKVDNVIITCAMNSTRREMLLETKKKILSVGGNILGVVINRMPLERIKAYTRSYEKYCGNRRSLQVYNDNGYNRNIS